MSKKRGDDAIYDSHIVEAQDLVQCGRLRNRIREQTQHAQLLFETLAYLEEWGAIPVRSKTIKTRYERVADSHAASPLSTLKSIQNHLSDLHARIPPTDKPESRGERRPVLRVRPEIVLDSRDEIETEPAW